MECCHSCTTQFLGVVINKTAYHLARYEPSSPSTLAAILKMCDVNVLSVLEAITKGVRCSDCTILPEPDKMLDIGDDWLTSVRWMQVGKGYRTY